MTNGITYCIKSFTITSHVNFIFIYQKNKHGLFAKSMMSIQYVKICISPSWRMKICGVTHTMEATVKNNYKQLSLFYL